MVVNKRMNMRTFRHFLERQSV